MNHQRTTAPTHTAAIHDQYQSLQGQLTQQYLGIGEEINFLFDLVVAQPSRQTLHAAVGFGPIGYLRGDTRQLAALATHDATDEGSQSGQMLGHTTTGLAGITLFQGFTYGTIASMVVTHRIDLLIQFRLKGAYTMRQPLLNIDIKMT